MKNRVLVLAAAFVVLGGLIWWLFFKPLSLDTVKEELKEKAEDLAQGKGKSDDLAALAVKAINLTQGEQGVELWRLKAEWGNMRREGGLLELEKPKFTYYMPPHNEEVRVSAETGDVNQASKLIRFRTNVLAHYGNNTIKGALMEYNGTAKVLTFPEGAVFEGPGMSGEAPLVTWVLEKQLIKADGGVNMTWQGDRPLPGSAAKPKAPAALSENGAVAASVVKSAPNPAAAKNAKAKGKPAVKAKKPQTGKSKAPAAKKASPPKGSTQKPRVAP